MLRLYLVRHGETVWNREGRLQGHTDVPLSAVGEAQARLLAARLGDEQIDAIWSSDLARARQTAEIIAAPKEIAVCATPLLRETMLGDWEGMTEAEVIARGDTETWKMYRRSPMVHRPPGSEPLEAVWKRILAARDSLRQEVGTGTALVVGHGGSLRSILCDAAGARVRNLNCFTLENASLSLIEYTDDLARIRFVNDAGHLKG